jgi:hypothetical protein
MAMVAPPKNVVIASEKRQIPAASASAPHFDLPVQRTGSRRQAEDRRMTVRQTTAKDLLPSECWFG